MTSNKTVYVLSLLLLSSSFSLLYLPCNAHNGNCTYDAIYQFGDSISDTGNFIREPAGANSTATRLPYGQTYFNKPTGRASDGRLIIDFIAEALGLPLLNPYLEKNASFSHGVNFAVAGSTSLNNSVLLQNGIISPVTNSSLNVQLDWFITHIKSICSFKTECANIHKSALFMVGEIGINDYNYAFFGGKTLNEVKSLVPRVVHNIADVANRLIELGATQLVVPGIFPIGCLPLYQTFFQNNTEFSFDKDFCLAQLNEFTMHHNEQLQSALQLLRTTNPKVSILYADYYKAFKWLSSHKQLGFSGSQACCGSRNGGRYNFELTRMCGAEGTTVCSNPDQSISWDGIHLTERAYQFMTQWLLKRRVFQCAA